MTRFFRSHGVDGLGSEASTILPTRKPKALHVFALGLLVRIIGVLLIWVGDGHKSVFSKVVVIIGVILSIGGITILKWLAMQPRRKRKPETTLPTPTPPVA